MQADFILRCEIKNQCPELYGILHTPYITFKPGGNLAMSTGKDTESYEITGNIYKKIQVTKFYLKNYTNSVRFEGHINDNGDLELYPIDGTATATGGSTKTQADPYKIPLGMTKYTVDDIEFWLNDEDPTNMRGLSAEPHLYTIYVQLTNGVYTVRYRSLDYNKTATRVCTLNGNNFEIID